MQLWQICEIWNPESGLVEYKNKNYTRVYVFPCSQQEAGETSISVARSQIRMTNSKSTLLLGSF
jgi:hypothetical protein